MIPHFAIVLLGYRKTLGHPKLMISVIEEIDQTIFECGRPEQVLLLRLEVKPRRNSPESMQTRTVQLPKALNSGSSSD
jgi:hypothetical protein